MTVERIDEILQLIINLATWTECVSGWKPDPAAQAEIDRAVDDLLKLPPEESAWPLARLEECVPGCTKRGAA